MSRGVWIGASFAVLVFGTLAALALLDEPLEPLARQLLERPEPPIGADNLFLAVHGFDAPANADPVQVGRLRVHEFESALRESQVKGGPLDYPRPHKATARDAEPLPLCDFTTEYCVAKSPTPSALLHALSEQNQAQLQRYERLKALTRLVTLGTPHVLSPMTRVASLLRIQRLELARIAELGQRGELTQMTMQLQREIEFNRRLLGLADTVLLKMLARSLLVRTLHVYAQLGDLGPQVARALDDLPGIHEPLSSQELSLEAPLAHEFRLQASIVQDTSLLADVADIDLVGVLSPLVIKPNATLNRLLARYVEPVRRFERMSMRDFASRWRRERRTRSGEKPGGALDWFLAWPLNPVGRLLMDISRPDLSGYYARIRDVEGFRRLALVKNLLRRDAIVDTQIEAYLTGLPPELRDPYTGMPLGIDREKRVLVTTQLYAEGRLRQAQADGQTQANGPNAHRPNQVALGPG